MTLTIEKTDIIKLEETINLLDIGDTLYQLLIISEEELKLKIINKLLDYLSEKINNPKYKIRVFTTTQGLSSTGFIICQIDPEYKSYGNSRCATFGWIHAQDFESCKLLMEACENYVREQGLKKIRGPINYPKFLGGVGYQVMGHNAPLMSGVSFNNPEMNETHFLKQLGYEPESEYTCVEVVQKNWDKGDSLDENIVIKFLTPNEIRALKPELMELARNSFYSVLADAPGGNSRIDEMFDSYDIMISYLKTHQAPIKIDPKIFFKVPKFIEFFQASDPINAVPCCPIALDKSTGEILGAIMALPNLYQIWKGERLTDINVDTAMVKKEYIGKGIFSTMNNIGQLMCRYRGAEYFEGTTIWSNNDRAIKTIFPHSILRRKHIVFQKRLLKK
ncbi:MAG: hypothetical protein ACFFKA_20490 [Candidatus Thorarchaeota archaeon]